MEIKSAEKDVELQSVCSTMRRKLQNDAGGIVTLNERWNYSWRELFEV